ncbi:MAG: hydantoinase [Syntrophobacterales bacterium CG03_land_8_20_14_0_80_58_14]|nr:MAG: hydantoinase [Syntrophobacterales bacterium CG03_land_8_20_14_0_80_58_14]
MILGIDVGGTHTDAVLIDHLRVLKKAKALTNPENLLSSLLEVTTELVDEATIDQLERVVLSTTISTNAIVQHKVDPVGIMAVSGPGLPPALLQIDSNTHILSGYLNHRGIEIATIDQEEASRIASRFRSEGIRNVGIIGKFSTRNPKQELELREIVRKLDHDPLQHVSLGHRMSGRLNFPRRIATAYLNEAIFRPYQRFVTQVLRFVHTRKITIPIYILKADGGTFDIAQSVEYPVQTILSGPAASIMGILATTGCGSDAIALDIGGTTTDIALFAAGVPLFEAFGVTIEGHRTLIRGLRTKSIGVGGDSVVRVREGRIFIGPEREGVAAACGGPFPTPTDAMIVLGMTVIGDAEKAAASLTPIAAALNCPVVEAARAIFDETCRKIAGHVRAVLDETNNRPVYTIHEMLEGKKLNPRTLYVVGGPAGPLAPELGRLLDCEAHIPIHAEVANAIGAALARTTAEMTLLADTERRTLTIAEEGFQTPIPPDFTMEDAIRIGREKLREKVLGMGAVEVEPEIEVVEAQEFNMVRDYHTSGKNIRVKVQVKPGCIADLRRGDALCR